MENVTIECLARILAEQGGITLISDEACDILTHISQGMYKNTDIGPYLKGYTGEPCKIHRKTSGTDRIQSCRLTMALATQPRPAETFCSNPEMREKGLLSRFLFVPVPDYGRRIVLSEPCPYQVEADFNERIISLLKMRNGTGEIYLDEEAIYVYNNFFYRIEDRLAEGKDLRTAEMKSWAGRCQGKALRIAALIHCLEHPEGPATVEISGDTMQEAVTLIEAYFLPAAQFMLEDKGNQEIYDIKRVYEFIRSRNGSVKKMDITYGLKGTDLNAKRIDVALKELTDAGLILTQVTPTAGRPLTTFWAAGQSGDTDR